MNQLLKVFAIFALVFSTLSAQASKERGGATGIRKVVSSDQNGCVLRTHLIEVNRLLNDGRLSPFYSEYLQPLADNAEEALMAKYTKCSSEGHIEIDQVRLAEAGWYNSKLDK
jgi:hypothetical protein